MQTIFPERNEGEMRRRNIADDIFCYVIKLSSDQIADLTIQALAEHFRVSRCHISRRFHNDRGMTLSTFIHRRKLLLAERFLMQEPELTVRSLAFRMGYANYQYFIARFKEQWGESPGRYRKLASDWVM
jgi:two-component system response regulator YesN